MDYFDFNSNNQKRLFVAADNPNYNELYWDKEGAKPWVENSFSIEGTPETITPIINDISKKASIEYSYYLDRQKRIGVPNYEQLSVQDEIKPTAFFTDAQSSRESDYARQNNITIVKVFPGMSIEQVAKETCGKRYLCIFNGFEVDGTKYTSPEQIVTAYDNYLSEKRVEIDEGFTR